MDAVRIALNVADLLTGGSGYVGKHSAQEDEIMRVTRKPAVPRRSKALRKDAPECGRHIATWARYGSDGCKLCDSGKK